VKQKAENNQYFYLMIALLIQLVIYPFFDGSPLKNMIMNLLSTVTILAALYAAMSVRKQLFIALGLALFAFLGIWYALIIAPHYYLAIVSVTCRILFNIYIIRLILLNLFRANQVTANTIYGAVAVYLLIGFGFSMLYTFLEGFMPGSFYFVNEINSTGNLGLSEFIYFSFSTLTSAGYGDIVPISSHARSLTSIQAVTGVLYVAVLISRFVGIFIIQYTEEKQTVNRRRDE